MRRRFVLLAMFLLLGAIVNIAVAWGLAIRISSWRALGWSGLTRHLVDPPALFIDVQSKAGATNIEAYELPLVGKSAVPPLPSWSRAHALTIADLQQGAHLWEQARGWPCVSLYWRRIDQKGVPGPIQGGVSVTFDRHATLPLIPIWPGFAINTLFYAAVLWLLFMAPFALRRWRRISRGLCPACAYPVGTSEVCTECGKPVSSKQP